MENDFWFWRGYKRGFWNGVALTLSALAVIAGIISLVASHVVGK